jgi:hypothetical protein
MPMNIVQADNQLILRYQPRSAWLFGLMFAVLGGTIAILALGLAANIDELSAFERFGALVAGLVGLALGLAFIVGSPVTIVVFDRLGGEVRIAQRGLFVRPPEAHPLAVIQSVGAVEEIDKDGDTYYHLQLVLQSGETVRLLPHRLPHYPSVERIAHAVETFLEMTDSSSV